MDSSSKATLPDQDDQPAVIAYRVGQLEQTQKDGFRDISASIKIIDNKLSDLATVSFVNSVVRPIEKRLSDLHASIANNDNKYVTRREMKIVTAILGFAVSATIALGTILLLFKK